MSNSIFVQLRRFPAKVRDLEDAIGETFATLGLSAPTVQLHPSKDGIPRPLEDSIFTVRGSGVHEHCWISFADYPQELTGDGSVVQMADVTTRGSWLFSGIVVYALFKFEGKVAFNDSGELDGQEIYDEAALKSVVTTALERGEQYMAR